MKKVMTFIMLTLILALCMMAMMSAVAFAADEGTGEPPGIDIDGAAVLGVFVIMVMLATLIESLAELVKAAIAPAKLAKWIWLCITSAIGIALCVIFNVDMFKAIGLSGGGAAIIAGQVITGIAIGAGSSFVHVLLGKMQAAKNAGELIPGVLLEVGGESDKYPPDPNTD
jgi:uncharacterized membrane protein YhaH (DUF805 family)